MLAKCQKVPVKLSYLHIQNLLLTLPVAIFLEKSEGEAL